MTDQTGPFPQAPTRDNKRRADAICAAITVGDLMKADRATLLELWSAVMDTPPPKGMSQAFLRRFIAFELQARQRGGLPKGLAARLERVASGAGRKAPLALRPGGRLLREWKGTTHVVDMIEGGCQWQGKTYPSLSAVARAITGAHWSGPRFFGLGSQQDVPHPRKASDSKRTVA